jgi:hypothetical protein
VYAVESYDANDEPDERQFVNHGRFANAAQALAAAKELIDASLVLSLAAGKSAADAYEEWRRSGDVPRIVPRSGASPIHFDPSSYALTRAQELHKRA